MLSSILFVGIHGDVIALDRATGREVWSVALKGADFVNLLLDGDRVFAASRGEVFCLDGATGQILWHNSLPGEGYGIVSLATVNGVSSPTEEAAERKRREAQSAAVIAAT